jgi:hypothetical protein
MNTTFFDQTEHLNTIITALDEDVSYWQLNKQLWLHFLSLVMQLTGMSMAIAAIHRDVRALPKTSEIDPDDVLSDRLFEMQQKNQAALAKLKSEKWPNLRWHHRMILSLSRALLARIHGQLGRLRVYIMEHDADISGLSSSGPFTQPAQLFKHLNGL